MRFGPRKLAKSAALWPRQAHIETRQERYIEFAKRTLPRNLSLEGLRVVVFDLRKRPEYRVIPKAVGWELGADVIPIGSSRTASTSIRLRVRPPNPMRLPPQSAASCAPIGIALDGDAERRRDNGRARELVAAITWLAVIGGECWHKRNGVQSPPCHPRDVNSAWERHLEGFGKSRS